jgi:OPT family oligopeptide transporter
MSNLDKIREEPPRVELTLRAVLTGACLGGALSLCNVYMGLKIGWSLNMSVTAALLSYGGYHLIALRRAAKGRANRPWGLFENNINQTAASAAASISSAGLVAPIPAWSLITGEQLTLPQLMLWTGSVALLGVTIAIALRQQFIERDQLAFPNGIATGETIQKIYAQGAEAMARVKMLMLGIGIGALAKLSIHLFKVKQLVMSGGVSVATWRNLTLSLSPSPLFVAVGILIGIRSGLSMLFGALIAWVFIGPLAITEGWITGTIIVEGIEKSVPLTDPLWLADHQGKMWFKEVVTWLLWPGVAMMVSSSLCSFVLSLLTIQKHDATGQELTDNSKETIDKSIGHPSQDTVPRKVHLSIFSVIVIFSICLQGWLFGITWWLATFGIVLSLILAVVAARVSGETGITPIGAMGKVTQLSFGLLAPGQVSANLMAANVTGGAASQCADLLHDLKAGLMIGASPRQQSYAQFAGVIMGAICGPIAYMILVGDLSHLKVLWDDPAWAMPAVVQWKAVAELFKEGIDALPSGAMQASIWGALIGLALSISERIVSAKLRSWIPSPAAIGMAFVIPAYYSISMAFGALIYWAGSRYIPSWSTRFMIVLASGLIAGDSLTGVGIALTELLRTP